MRAAVGTEIISDTRSDIGEEQGKQMNYAAYKTT